MNDIQYMQRAMQLALKGRGATAPNPIVGAVIVGNGKVIAEGYHARYGGDHAEVAAFKNAGGRACGATLYVTLEPCSHFGQTPPCVDAVIKSGVKRVVIGMKDPNPLVNGKSIRLLKKAGIDVSLTSPEMTASLERMNETFVTYMTKKRPFVTVKTAQTMDGKIATAKGQSKWITSQTSRDFARQRRNEFSAILVGINTVLNDDPQLTAADQDKRLIKVIVDSELKISQKAKLFKDTIPDQVIVAATSKASKAKVSVLQKKATVLISPVKDSRVDLKWLMGELAKRKISSVLIEGGAAIIGDALKNGLVDKLNIYIAPKILGDDTARGSVSGLKIANVDQSIRLKDLSVQMIGEDILVEGYVHGNH